MALIRAFTNAHYSRFCLFGTARLIGTHNGPLDVPNKRNLLYHKSPTNFQFVSTMENNSDESENQSKPFSSYPTYHRGNREIVTTNFFISNGSFHPEISLLKRISKGRLCRVLIKIGKGHTFHSPRKRFWSSNLASCFFWPSFFFCEAKHFFAKK